jgi:hypothetical protein
MKSSYFLTVSSKDVYATNYLKHLISMIVVFGKVRIKITNFWNVLSRVESKRDVAFLDNLNGKNLYNHYCFSNTFLVKIL